MTPPDGCCSTSSMLGKIRKKAVEGECAGIHDGSATELKSKTAYLIPFAISTTGFKPGISASLKDDFSFSAAAAEGGGWVGAMFVATFSAMNAVNYLYAVPASWKKGGVSFFNNTMLPAFLGGLSAILSAVLQVDEGAKGLFIACAFTSGLLTNGNNFRNWRSIIAKITAVFDPDIRCQAIADKVMKALSKKTDAELDALQRTIDALLQGSGETATEFAIRKINTLLDALDISYRDIEIIIPSATKSRIMGSSSVLLSVIGALPYILNVAVATGLLTGIVGSASAASGLAITATVISFSINALINTGSTAKLSKMFLDFTSGDFSCSMPSGKDVIKTLISAITAISVGIFYDDVTIKSLQKRHPSDWTKALGALSGTVNGLNVLIGTLFTLEKYIFPTHSLITQASALFTAVSKLPLDDRTDAIEEFKGHVDVEMAETPEATERSRLLEDPLAASSTGTYDPESGEYFVEDDLEPREPGWLEWIFPCAGRPH